MLRLVLLVLLLVSSVCHISFAQAPPLSGHVATASGQPVPFATVGVKGQAIGSISDAKGRFSFAAPATLAPTDSVVISCVGFRSQRLTIAQLRRADAVWTLQPMSQLLQEVQVQHRQLQPGIIGHRGTLSLLTWSTYDQKRKEKQKKAKEDPNDEFGWEMAAQMRVRKSSFVNSFHLYIGHNDFRHLRLRFLLYDVRNGQPGALLLQDDVQLTVDNQRTGWVVIDLRPYHLHLVKGQAMAAGVQWLEGTRAQPRKYELCGPAFMPVVGSHLFIRQKSQAPWEKYPASVSMYLSVQQYE